MPPPQRFSLRLPRHATSDATLACLFLLLSLESAPCCCLFIFAALRAIIDMPPFADADYAISYAIALPLVAMPLRHAMITLPYRR